MPQVAEVLRAHPQAARIISHRFPLREAAHAYGLFDGKRDGCTKAILVCMPAADLPQL